MHKKILLAVCLFIVFSVQAQLKWPDITKTSKPWTRWWWEGNAVNKKDLTWNLEQYQKAGLGGVELTPIYGVYGYEKQFIDFLSPQWMQLFMHTLKEAKRLDVGVDLANGTGWPFGGPWVTDDDASKTIYYKTYSIKEGESLKDIIEYNQEALVRTANNKPAGIDSILRPVSKNKNLQALALDQIQYPGKLPLKKMMAYSDGKAALDITNRVDLNGKLNWRPPSGKWTLYALFEGLHGKMVERAAPGGEGYAIDHFSAIASKNYFKKFDNAFKGNDISYLRSFFNDSYEVDDARGQGNWTPQLFAEFKKRKGYLLEDNLPALFGKDEADKNSRVIYDYRSVIDELLLENFTITWKKWATTKGKMVRNQSHGSPANTLDLYSVVDIPETEGNDILRFKFATSAANVMGKKLASSESATWLNEHFLSSLGDVKKAIDLYFLGGVNHIFYHGTAYSPKDAPWPGWLFYAAVHFQPSNPQWKDFHKLNEYIARVQSFLQQGRPDNDVLVYYPIVDRYSEPGNALLQHFDGMERNFEKTDFEHVSKWMLENGYSFDFFSDRQLQNFNVSENKIISGGNKYQSILLPANKLIPAESMEKLIALAKNGATIIFYKDLPADVPGYGKLEERRDKFQKMITGLSFKQLASGTRVSVFPKGGMMLSSGDIDQLLGSMNIRQERMVASGLQFIRRINADTAYYFVVNSSKQKFDDLASIDGKYNTVLLFDPMNIKKGMAKFIPEDDHTTNIRMQLQPGESIIIKAFNSTIKAEQFTYLKTTEESQVIKGDWTIEFLNGGPVLPPTTTITKLKPWTDIDGDVFKNFSGTARYTISFNKPTGASPNWILDLGEVNTTAEVVLNGKSIGTLIGPVFNLVIPSSALQQSNKLEVIVANLMANRIAYMDKNSMPWKIFYNTNMPARRRENSKNGIFDASGWKPLVSGLSGPVSLTPVTNE